MQLPIDQNRANLYTYASGDSFTGKEIGEVFNEIYQERVWDHQEVQASVSGIGSSVEQTQEIINQLPALVKQFNIQSILDIPCGDFHWMKRIVHHFRQYTGADIVQELVTANHSRYANHSVQFLHLNLIEDELPKYDLIFCRDCLVHFSFRHITEAVARIKSSQSTYLLTTTFPMQETNQDIVTGGWRPLNLQKPPFHFPEPLAIINEKCTEMNGAFSDKSLGLWEIKTI